MSTRDEYQPGVPCWVDTLQPDPARALTFYGPLFGWDFTEPGAMPGDPPGEYFVARVAGRDVAAIGTQPPGTPTAWNTYVAVASADGAAEAAASAGGEVIVPPVDAAPAGRFAVVSDPSGAPLGLWEARERNGAQRVNEAGAWAMSMLRTSEPERCAEFYLALFGWHSEPFGDDATLFRLPGYVGGEPQQPVARDVVAAMVATDQGPGPQWGVDFWVNDADQAAETAARRGGNVLAAPSGGPGGMRQAVLADPAGAAFSVTTSPSHA